jgi:integrase
MRGLGRIFRMPGSRFPWIAYCHRGKEHRESTGPAIREIERKHRKRLAEDQTRKVAENVLKQRLKEIGADALGLRAFVGPQQDRLTVSQMLDALEADFRLRGLKSLSQAKGHLRDVRTRLGDLRAVDVSAETISRYIEQRLAEGKAPGTINRRTALLSEAFRLAIKRRQLSAMPQFQKLREDNARQGFFSSAEFFAVLAKVGDEDVACFLEWFFWTGMRPGEIRRLTWQAFDPETWTLRLHARDAKIGEGRIIALEGPLRTIIEHRVRKRRLGCDLIFHRSGEKAGTFYKRWKKACLEAGVVGKIPYDLRRTAVRNMVRAGVPERVAMSISGHKTRAVFDRYNIVSEKDLRDAMIRTSTYVKSLAPPIHKGASSVSPLRVAKVVAITQRPAINLAK